jgi:purine-binding chemotaxis protein CheW
MQTSSSRNRSDRTKNLVGFVVGGIRYAVDILRVREIVNPQEIVALPHAPPVVVGVADHRGEVMPILDLRRRFGLPSETPTRRTKWIIVRVGKRSAGLVVDAVTEVFGAGQDSAREVPEVGVGDASRGISAVYSHEGSLVFVIDVDRIAAAAEAIEARAALGSGNSTGGHDRGPG